jgi:hypothetical protein
MAQKRLFAHDDDDDDNDDYEDSMTVYKHIIYNTATFPHELE